MTEPPSGEESRIIWDTSHSYEIISGLREALKFYADTKNYLQRGWQGDPDPSRVDSDNGKIAREALKRK